MHHGKWARATATWPLTGSTPSLSWRLPTAVTPTGHGDEQPHPAVVSRPIGTLVGRAAPGEGHRRGYRCLGRWGERTSMRTATWWLKVTRWPCVYTGHGPENETLRSGQWVAPTWAGEPGKIGVVRIHVGVVFERELRKLNVRRRLPPVATRCRRLKAISACRGPGTMWLTDVGWPSQAKRIP